VFSSSLSLCERVREKERKERKREVTNIFLRADTGNVDIDRVAKGKQTRDAGIAGHVSSKGSAFRPYLPFIARLGIHFVVKRRDRTRGKRNDGRIPRSRKRDRRIEQL